MTTASASNKSAASARRGPGKGWRSFGLQVTIALVLGVIVGLVARQIGTVDKQPNSLTDTLNNIGSVYVTLLKDVVVPLIFLAIVASIGNLRRVANAARLAWKTIYWFAITALIAVVIGIVIGTVLQPGIYADASALKPAASSTSGSWWGFLNGLVPANFLGLQVGTKIALANSAASATSSVSFNVLQVIVVAFVVGIAALKVGPKAEAFLEFTDAALKIVQRIIWWIIRLAPIGTFALIASAVVNYGWTTIGSLAWFVAAVYIGLALVLFVVYPVLLRLNGLSVKQYFSGVWPALQLAFVSRSSVGTLPVTSRVTERFLGVPTGYASFAVPFGATTKMDGCAAIFPAIAAIFIAQFYGIQLDLIQYILIAVVAVIGSAATAGTTGAVVMLTLTLSTLGLPLEGVGLLLAVDPILDMGRTAVNVAGQALVPTIVAKREGILDLDLYNAPRSAEVFTEEDEEALEDEQLSIPRGK